MGTGTYLPAKSVGTYAPPAKLDENVAGADSVLWSLRCPARTRHGPPDTPGSSSDRSLREIADSTKRSLRQPRQSYFRPCGSSQPSPRIEWGRIRSEGAGSNPSPVPRRLEKTPSRATLSPRERAVSRRVTPHPGQGTGDCSAARRWKISIKQLTKDTAAGVMPGMREAWPRVSGRTRMSFSVTSRKRPETLR